MNCINRIKKAVLACLTLGTITTLNACIDDEQPSYNPIRNEVEIEEPEDNPDVQEDIDLSLWELVWEDEFEYTSLEELKENWTPDDYHGYDGILSGRYPENIDYTGESIKLCVRHEKIEGSTKDYSAASITSKQLFKYGYFEARYKYTAAYGVNNAFWLRGSAPFEIDINEGHYPYCMHTSVHDETTGGTTSSKTTFFDDVDFAQYHLFSAEWDENKIVFYKDRQKIYEVPNEVCHGDVPILFSTAVLQCWNKENPLSGSTLVPEDIHNTFMEIDYVRVYKR